MGEQNTIYPGVIEFHDPDIIVGYLPPVLPFGKKKPLYLPPTIRDLIRKNNELSNSTVQAVKVPFTVGTDRKVWVVDRINSVDQRVKHIKTRTDALLSNLQDKSDPAYNALLTGFSLAVSAVPVVGALIVSIVGKDQAAQKQAAQIDQLKTQILIRDYTDDLKSLASIRIQLAYEHTGPPIVPKLGDENTLNAASAIPLWYYYVGAFVLLMVFLVILKNRQERR